MNPSHNTTAQRVVTLGARLLRERALLAGVVGSLFCSVEACCISWAWNLRLKPTVASQRSVRCA